MATTISNQISALATQVGTDVKQIIQNIGDLSKLTTTQKASLVVALNELKAGLTAVEGQLGAQIDDSSTATDKTWSSTKINTQISAAVSGLINGAPETLDTLKELADALETNKDAIEALQALAAGHVKYDSAQSLTSEQQAQARTNISAAGSAELSAVDAKIGALGSLETSAKGSTVAAINEVKLASDAASSAASAADAKATAADTKATEAQTAAGTAQSTASAAQSAVNTLSQQVGDTQADFVAIYTTARDGAGA